MPRPKWAGNLVFAALLALLLVVAAGAMWARPRTAPVRAATVPPWTCGTWSTVTSASVASQLNFLSGVTGLPSGSAWAAGYYVSNGTHLQTLVERNNGGAWSIVASPNSGSSDALYGIAAVSTSDVWAVGAYVDTGAAKTLVEQWSGTSMSVVSSPNVGTGDNVLNGAAAIASNDVWAVGYSGGSGGLGGVPGQALIEHYDGTSWAAVSTPGSALTNSTLQAVAASSANDVWAVGYYEAPSGTARTLIEHYDGTTWSTIPAPDASSQSNLLFGVAANSASDAWAVGFSESPPASHTLAEHWNGRYWSLAALPDGGPTLNSLYGVTAISASDVWAVGQFENPQGVNDALTEHWNGTTWSMVPSPDPGDVYNLLKSVVAVSANTIWAVGDQQSRAMSGQQTLVEHYTQHASTGPCGGPR